LVAPLKVTCLARQPPRLWSEDLEPHAFPPGITHRAISHLPAATRGLENRAHCGALIYGYDFDGLEVLF